MARNIWRACRGASQVDQSLRLQSQYKWLHREHQWNERSASRGTIFVDETAAGEVLSAIGVEVHYPRVASLAKSSTEMGRAVDGVGGPWAGGRLKGRRRGEVVIVVSLLPM